MTLQEPKKTPRKHSPKRQPYGSRKPPKVEPLLTGRKLAEMRARAGLTQAELARRLGYGRQYIYHMEAGDCPVPKERVEQIVTLLTAAKAERDALLLAMLTTF